MPTYLKQSSQNDAELILGATHPTTTREVAAKSEQRHAPKESKWLLSTNEAARLLGLSPHTLSKWRITGMGPPFQSLGRRCLYAPETLHHWAASRAKRSTSDPGVGVGS
jgi:hypothetical protein